MALKLMYITNRADVAKIAQDAGVDIIFVDMEFIGKEKRQGNLDSVKNHHTVSDVKTVRNAITKAKLLVRVNPIHEATDSYYSSQDEIDDVIAAGADMVMLPYFKTVKEVEQFIHIVNNRAKAILLLETREAVEDLDNILKISGIDGVHIGLNDLSISYGQKFMFQPLADGTVEKLCLRLQLSDIPYGFGGIASIGMGMLPSELILKEHYRLGSSAVILSRSFCDVNKDTDIEYIRQKFSIGVRGLRAFETEIGQRDEYFSKNKIEVEKCVEKILNAQSSNGGEKK